MAADINIVIRTQDTASAIINKTAANADQQLKRIQTNARSGKASIDLFGTLAKSLGATGLGAYSAEISGVTEKLNGLASAGVGVKAGLAGVAAVVGFKVGTEIGNWVFETEKFTKQLTEANSELQKAAEIAAGLAAIKLSIATQKIELIEDPAEQEAAYRARITALTNEAGIHSQNIKLAKEQWEIEDQTISGRARMLLHAKEITEMRAAEVAEDQKKLDGIEKERAAILGKFNIEAQELEQLKEKAKLQEKSDSYLESLSKQLGVLEAGAKSAQDAFAEIASQNTFGDDAAQEAELLLEKIDLLTKEAEAKKKLKDEEQRAVEKKKADAQKIADLQKTELANLEQQRILLTQGAEAAQKFALEQKGLDKAAAEKIASEQTEIDKLAASKNVQTGTQATESRLLTRGPAEKGIDKIATNTEKMVTEIRNVNRAITELDYKGAHVPEAVTVG